MNQMNFAGNTPLMIAGKIRLEIGVLTTGFYFKRLLDFSARGGDDEIVDILLRTKPDVNAENNDLQTALHQSIENGSNH